MKTPKTDFIRQITFFRLVVIFFISILCAIGIIFFLFYKNSRAFNSSVDLITQTRNVLDQTNNVLLFSEDLQIQARNYVLNIEPIESGKYRQVRRSLSSCAKKLEQLVSGSSAQQAISSELLLQINNLMLFADTLVLQKEQARASIGRLETNVKQLDFFYREIEKHAHEIISQQNSLLATRRNDALKFLHNSHVVSIAAAIVIVILLASTLVFILYYFKKQQKVHKILAESENRFQTLINSTKDLAIFTIDDKGYILDWYEGAHNIKGYNKEEVIGRNISIFYTPESIAAGEPEHNLEVAAQTGSFETEGWRVRKDGSHFWADVLITAIYDAQGNLQGFTKVTRDFSLHKKMEDEKLKAFEKEQELNALKSNFVSMASHEFRTPLSTILSSVSLLEYYKTTETQDKRDKHIQRITSAVTEMVATLEEFLSLEKIEEGKVQIKNEMFNLKELAQQAETKFNTALKPGQVIEHSHNGDEEVCLDKGFITHILDNLLSNAVKYSPEDTTVIFETRVNKTTTTLKVKDHGIGISPEDQKHLFERFFRASNTGNIKGTGLGLHIVKRYIDLMHGTIELKSEIGNGSIFIVTIPC